MITVKIKPNTTFQAQQFVPDVPAEKAAQLKALMAGVTWKVGK